MTPETLKRDYVAICGPFPEPINRYPEEKRIQLGHKQTAKMPVVIRGKD